MKASFALATLGTAVALSLTAQADRIKSGAHADFATRELKIPCVQVSNLSEDTEGDYYDVVLMQRGNSMNFELAFAEPEDAALCESVSNYLEFNDDASTDDDEDDDSTDDNRAAALFAECEVRQDRSKIKVKAKYLADGDYYAVVTSGGIPVESQVHTYGPSDDELEVEFDSDAGDILEGAEALDAGFIVDRKVDVSLYSSSDSTALFSTTALCMEKD